MPKPMDDVALNLWGRSFSSSVGSHSALMGMYASPYPQSLRDISGEETERLKSQQMGRTAGKRCSVDMA